MRAPYITLVLMLLAAAVALVGGGRLARREVEERLPVNRALLREFGDQLQTELARLEDVYQHDLAEVASAIRRGSAMQIRDGCATICGIRECHIVSLKGRENPPSVSIPSQATDRVPDLVSSWESRPTPTGPEIILDVISVRNASDRGGPARGWLKSNDTAFAGYWYRQNPEQAVAFVIDRREIAERTNEYIKRWMTASYAAIRSAGDAAALKGPGGVVLAGNDVPFRHFADFQQPMHNRLGTWQILGWDRSTTVVHYDAGALAIAATISAMLALLGIGLFRHQCSAARLAEQRVSFVNRVSHELGSPLTNILLNIDLAAEQIAVRPDDSRRRLRLVTEEIQRLARLVGNVLTFSKRERGTLQLRSTACVPDDVIAGVLAQFEPALVRRDIAVEWQRNAADGVLLDSDALAQIVGNLISNVEKYAADGAWLGLESRFEADTLLVRVADRGPGIPENHRNRIFLPFERVSSSVDEGVSGTGLGLAIARDLAQQMRGSLVLVPGDQGAAFELCIPVQRVIVPLDSESSAA